MEKEKYTTMDAVREVLTAWKPGTEMLGYEIAEAVRQRTYARNGSRPLDATVLRYVRTYKGVFGITVPKYGESLYRKDLTEGRG